MAVSTAAEHEVAGAYFNELCQFEDAVKERFLEGKSAADKLHKWICRLERDLLTGPAEVKKRLTRAISDYEVARDRSIREEQAKLQAAEIDRAKESLLTEAVALEQAGDSAAANHRLDAPPVAAVIEMEKPRVAGMNSRKKYRKEVVDESQVKDPFWCLDHKKIDGVVDKMGPDAEELVGGIRVFEERVIARSRS